MGNRGLEKRVSVEWHLLTFFWMAIQTDSFAKYGARLGHQGKRLGSTVEENKCLEIGNTVENSIVKYYKTLGREIRYFKKTKDSEWDSTYLYFLVDRKHVIRYGFGIDRVLSGGVELGIGPDYFGSAAFWSYQDSTRFISSISEDSIFNNLRLLDEYWDGKEADC